MECQLASNQYEYMVLNYGAVRHLKYQKIRQIQEKVLRKIINLKNLGSSNRIMKIGFITTPKSKLLKLIDNNDTVKRFDRTKSFLVIIKSF